MSEKISFDALIPAAMANKAENVGVAKGNMDAISMFFLAILAGAFIAMGAVFCTTAVTNGGDLPYGITKLLGGLAFCLGLILVVVAGAELFTGNNLIVMAVASKKLPMSKLLRNWVIVYVGNLIGSVLTAYLMYLTRTWETGAGGALGITAVNIAGGKAGLTFVVALTRGIFCNALVCLAVWLCFSARSVEGKILAIIFPIAAFVAAGFEHCVANMYFIPAGLFIKSGASPEYLAAAKDVALANLTWGKFFIGNLLPVTIGNIIGGSGFVGVVYWIVYRRNAKD
ncbi:MAG: formate/nitrite family transporter [Candidatus Alcyoniella australis]|nr:formate/nitrite family transporter [Candidatus Alcyoniella australis]